MPRPSDRRVHCFNQRIRVLQPHANAGDPLVGLDNRIVLLDTGPMIGFPAAQHFWFFGYPTMLAAEGTRVI
jgi:hypothetical protein